jgi:hypothetical protein
MGATGCDQGLASARLSIFKSASAEMKSTIPVCCILSSNNPAATPVTSISASSSFSSSPVSGLSMRASMWPPSVSNSKRMY